MEDRRISDLGVDDAVAGQVLAAFVRDALERFLRLHDRDRVREPAQIKGQRARGRARVEPSAELARVRRRETLIPQLAREVDDRRWTQPAVEMVVEQYLRC